jgi:hypothetical protein
VAITAPPAAETVRLNIDGQEVTDARPQPRLPRAPDQTTPDSADAHGRGAPEGDGGAPDPDAPSHGAAGPDGDSN